MKRLFLFGLSFCLVGSFIFLLLEYKKYINLNDESVFLNKEITNLKAQLEEIPLTISNLEEEEKEIKLAKDKPIKEYEKWVRQNQILEDLLK
ncbi:MAG: hypothetical protein ACOXZW_01415 [Bacilli bacterium]|jgi:uncharacterized protein YacL (UPF0231 family)